MVRNNERLEVELLTCNDLKSETQTLEDWKVAFGEQRFPKDCGNSAATDRAVPLLAAPAIAGIIAGFLVDAASAEIKREASEYESQYHVTRAEDRFWIATNDSDARGDPSVPYDQLVQHYFALRVIREAGSPRQPALELTVGLAPSFDQQMFQLAPLSLLVQRTRAKVLSDELWWWFLPTAWIGKLLRTSGHEVSVNVALSVEAYWKDKDQNLRVTKVAQSDWSFPSYSIEAPEPLRTACSERPRLDAKGNEEKASDGEVRTKFVGTIDGKPCSLLKNGASSWLMSVPVSIPPGPGKGVRGRGTFSVDVSITERDPSNAKQYLEDAARLLTEEKPKIVDSASKAAGGK